MMPNSSTTLTSSKNNSVLIIGKIPPPIGGVTIHVGRLLDHMEHSSVTPVLYDLNTFTLGSFIKAAYTSQVAHIHSSNPLFRLFAVVLLKLFFNKSIITIHGDLGRFGALRNWADRLAVRLCTIPIVLNQNSYRVAQKVNKRSTLISAFLPPVKEHLLSNEIKKQVDEFTKDRKNVYCTNAYDVSFDKAGNEIYGISELVKRFAQLPDFSLIFSDPSGNYAKYLETNGVKRPDNVLIISEPHNFVEIIKQSEGLLRTTTTDGDSLSVKEGLFYEKRVICSDCVQRPEGCELYRANDWSDFLEVLKSTAPKASHTNLNGFPKILETYESMI